MLQDLVGKSLKGQFVVLWGVLKVGEDSSYIPGAKVLRGWWSAVKYAFQ